MRPEAVAWRNSGVEDERERRRHGGACRRSEAAAAAWRSPEVAAAAAWRIPEAACAGVEVSEDGGGGVEVFVGGGGGSVEAETESEDADPWMVWQFFSSTWFDRVQGLIHANTCRAKCAFGPGGGAESSVDLIPWRAWIQLQTNSIHGLPNEA